MTTALAPTPTPTTPVAAPVFHTVEVLERPEPTDRDALLAYLTSLAESGRRSMRLRLKTAAGLLGFEDVALVPWSRLRFEHLTALKTALRERGLSPASLNATLYAVRGVVRAAWNLGLVSGEEYQRLREVKPVRAERLPRGRALGRGEVLALVDVCHRDQTPRGLRDLAVVAVLYSTGLRREELVSLDLDDFDAEDGALRVLGKGDRERLVYLSRGARRALDHWLGLRGEESGPLFLPLGKGGRLLWRRLSGQSVHALLKRRAREAGVATLSPHDFRRTFVSHLLSLGVDIATVQRMAGHQSVTTTARYDRRGEEEKKVAAEMLELPLPDLPAR